jgi:hypothetical protein
MQFIRPMTFLAFAILLFESSFARGEGRISQASACETCGCNFSSGSNTCLCTVTRGDTVHAVRQACVEAAYEMLGYNGIVLTRVPKKIKATSKAPPARDH